MSEVERYLLDKYPSLVGTAREYVLATDYDDLERELREEKGALALAEGEVARVRAQARRLRAALIDEQEDDYSDNCLCATCTLIRETADLVTP